MAGNSFGQLFKITTFGESHGGCVGAVLDGCPPGIEISEEEIQKDLNRRKPGQSSISTPRKEEDKINIMSGVFEGKTTGTPILLLTYNKDIKPEDYLKMKDLYRPGHADFTYSQKYGIRDWQGSGRASARETLARVATGTIAKKYLKERLGVEILSYVEQVGNINTDIDFNTVSMEQIESNIIRCPDDKIAQEMIGLIDQTRQDGDSIGGIIRGVIKNVPIGLGEPVFDKLPADLSKAMMSINAVKGFEIGSGFQAAKMKGSEHNDQMFTENNKIKFKTNFAGGTLGGISSGQTIYFRVAFKPVSTISKQLGPTGRHDPCVLPRAVPIVDAMSALVIMDHFLRNKAQNS